MDQFTLRMRVDTEIIKQNQSCVISLAQYIFTALKLVICYLCTINYLPYVKQTLCLSVGGRHLLFIPLSDIRTRSYFAASYPLIMLLILGLMPTVVAPEIHSHLE